MPSQIDLIQALALLSLLHLPIGILSFIWVYRHTESSRELIFWGGIIWAVPTFGAIIAFLRFLRRKPPRKAHSDSKAE